MTHIVYKRTYVIMLKNNNKNDKMTTDINTSVCAGEYIYVIKISEYARCGDLILKIGRTENLFNRIKQYPKGSLLLYAQRVFDFINAEKRLKEFLDNMKSCCKSRKDIGSEWYEVVSQETERFLLCHIPSIILEYMSLSSVKTSQETKYFEAKNIKVNVLENVTEKTSENDSETSENVSETSENNQVKKSDEFLEGIKLQSHDDQHTVIIKYMESNGERFIGNTIIKTEFVDSLHSWLDQQRFKKNVSLPIIEKVLKEIGVKMGILSKENCLKIPCFIFPNPNLITQYENEFQYFLNKYTTNTNDATDFISFQTFKTCFCDYLKISTSQLNTKTVSNLLKNTEIKVQSFNFCKHCGQRAIAKCCEDYNPKDRSKAYCLFGIKLLNLDFQTSVNQAVLRSPSEKNIDMIDRKDVVTLFLDQYVNYKEGAFFTLRDVNDCIKQSNFSNSLISITKEDIEEHLNIVFEYPSKKELYKNNGIIKNYCLVSELSIWIEMHIELTNNKNDRIKTIDLFNIYNDDGINKKSSVAFGKELARMCHIRSHSINGQRYYEGIRIKNIDLKS